MIAPRAFLKKVLRNVRHRRKQYCTIGRYRVRLAADSHLLEYKRQFHNYDTALGDIARILSHKYPSLQAIDIGANIGDTAALIRKFSDIPVLCIEGDPILLPILIDNATRIGPGLTIEASFVGLDGQTVNTELIEDLGRNASLAHALAAPLHPGSGLGHPPRSLRSLASILRDHPDFNNAKLLKTDTEGLDFDILRQSLDFIRRSRPVLFFEYDPHFRLNEPKAGLDTIKILIQNEYSDFIYYDNFGNFLLHATSEQWNILTDLDNYLASNRAHGVAVHYFDVCAFHKDDADLALAVRHQICSVA